MPFVWDTTVRLLEVLPDVPEAYWRWKEGETPMGESGRVFGAVGAYLVAIALGRLAMQNRKPFELRYAFMAHNALLSLASLWLLALFVEQVVPIYRRHGFFYSICDKEAWTPELVTLYMVNYYFKYWELADTAFLVLKKKPLQFLHVFHHASVVVLAFNQIEGHLSTSWTVVVANLSVHVLMYYYYYVTTAYRGYKPWYKKAVTVSQITQFVVDLFIVYFAAYSYYAAEYSDWLPTYGTCYGTEKAAWYGCSILTSYLYLFVEFFYKTYGRKGRSGRGRRQADGVHGMNGTHDLNGVTMNGKEKSA